MRLAESAMARMLRYSGFESVAESVLVVSHSDVWKVEVIRQYPTIEPSEDMVVGADRVDAFKEA